MNALTACVLALSCAAAGCAHTLPPRQSAGAPKDRLTTFRSDAELASFLVDLARKQDEERLLAMGSMAETVSVTASAAVESVTNVQHAGVDEGGIVKVCGDHLVVLRRGRLFTVRIGDDSLMPVTAVDAFGPEVDPSATWYDEMLVSGRTVVVIGYSYGSAGTELGLFRVDHDGRLHHRATYHLRSSDYYSSRNYASRLIGNKLIFYTPLPLRPDEGAPLSGLPALRRLTAGVTAADFKPIYSARRIYAPILDSKWLTLHTVTTCDLAEDRLTCEATAVMGPPGRVFYVSPAAVYVWMTEWGSSARGRSPSLLYRLPLGAGQVQAARVSGGPVDQLSFLERDGFLNVLVRAESDGEGMWRAEVSEGDMALLRVPLHELSSNVLREVRRERYRPLPTPESHGVQNRYVGDFVLYGAGQGWGRLQDAPQGQVIAFRYASDEEPHVLALGHGVDRIESLGRGAVVVGADDEDLHFTTVALDGDPRIVDRYSRRDASQGELRTHGFFYRPDGTRAGTLGLPIRGAGRPGYEHLIEDSASILFLRQDRLRLHEMGELASMADPEVDDGCRSSCVDWYGNARPLFLRDRILALLGYELVEGASNGVRVDERRRVSFAPEVRPE